MFDHPCFCGDGQSGLEVAVSRPVPRFAVRRGRLDYFSGLVEFVSGRDVDGRHGCFGRRVDAHPRFTYRVPQVASSRRLLFVPGGGLESGECVLQRGHPVPGDLPGAGHLIPGSVLLQLRSTETCLPLVQYSG